MKEKVREIEVLRSMSFIAVVFQHVIGYLGYLPNLMLSDIMILSFLLTVNRFAIPVFVFITGFVLFYNYYDQLDCRRFAHNRVKDILIPYISWAVIYNIAFQYSKSPDYHNILQHTKDIAWGVITGNGMYHLWYIVMILQMYLIFPVVRKLFIRYSGGKFALSFVLAAGAIDCLLLFAAAFIIPPYLNSHGPGLVTDFFTEYRHKVFISWLFYFALGGYVAVNYERFKMWLKEIEVYNAILLGLASLGLVVLTFLDVGSGIKGGDIYDITAPLSIKMFIYSILALVFVYNLARGIEKRHKTISLLLKRVGKYSYGAYLIHPIYIYFVCKELVQPYSLNLFAQILIDTVLCCALSFLTVSILNKTPLLNFFLVRPQKSKHI